VESQLAFVHIGGVPRGAPALARVYFTPNLVRHIGDQNGFSPGSTVREVLDAHFGTRPHVRGYVLDDQGALRRHMNIVVSGAPIKDRIHLSDPVPENGEIYVIQALSGG
jgi:hypothetical protein